MSDTRKVYRADVDGLMLAVYYSGRVWASKSPTAVQIAEHVQCKLVGDRLIVRNENWECVHDARNSSKKKGLVK
jgi:hypothetical protein